jgi:hypothetical protein
MTIMSFPKLTWIGKVWWRVSVIVCSTAHSSTAPRIDALLIVPAQITWRRSGQALERTSFASCCGRTCFPAIRSHRYGGMTLTGFSLGAKTSCGEKFNM